MSNGQKREREHNKRDGKSAATEVRPDLQDASNGKDLSYLNEMPQMGGYEGVKAGVPPPKKEDKK